MSQPNALHDFRHWLQVNWSSLKWTLAIAVICVALSYLVPMALTGLFHKEITLYYGPRGGSGATLARTISEYTRQNTWSGDTFGRRFDVKLHDTDGGAENRQIVELDTEGRTIGFASDGLEPPNNKIRTLVPLYSMQFHVIVRREIYDEIRREAARMKPLRGGSVLESMLAPLTARAPADTRTLDGLLADAALIKRPLRFFCGGIHSDTKLVSAAVLESFGLKVSDIENRQDLDWNQVADILSKSRTAGSPHELDGTLYLGPVGAQHIKRIARSGQCYLLGIDSVGGLMATNREFQAAKFAKNSYDARNNFCDRDLNSVAVRQVVICPTNLGSTDAFLLASMLSRVLREAHPEIAWDPGILGKGESLDLRYPLHPGAQAFRNGKPPSWTGVVIWFWTALLLPWHRSILAAFSKGLDWLRDETPTTARDAQRSVRGRELKRQLQEMEIEWESLPASPLEEAAYTDWQTRIQTFRATLRQEITDQNVPEVISDELLRGLRNLRVELAARRPANLPSEVALKLDEDLRDVLVEVQTIDKDVFEVAVYDAYVTKSKDLKDRIRTAMLARQLTRDRSDDLVAGLKELREELRQRKPKRPRTKPASNGSPETHLK